MMFKQGLHLSTLSWGLLVAIAGTTHLAQADGFDPRIIPGIVLSAGRVDSQRDGGPGSGYFLDTNYTRTFINGGGNFKDFGSDKIVNVYGGTGISKLLQLQVGYGNHGMVQRLRHDLNLTSVYDFLTGTKRSPYNRTVDNRITFTFAIERYSNDSRFDNTTIGFGLLY